MTAGAVRSWLETKFAPRPSPSPLLEPLLQPIPGDSPSGEWLYYEGTYDRIREARREEDASLPQGIWQRDLKRANWAEVQRLTTAALTARSKDLQLGAWLLEAWVHLDGFAGASAGFQLLLELCRQYWPDLHPGPDGDSFAARAMIMSWVNDRLPLALKSVPLTHTDQIDARQWTWFDREELLRLENFALRTGGQTPPDEDIDPRFTMANLAAATAATPRTVRIANRESLSDAVASAHALSGLLDERCGKEAPSLAKAIETMESIRDWIADTLAESRDGRDGTERMEQEEAVEMEPGEVETEELPDLIEAETSEETAAPRAVLGERAATREAAYRQLHEAAQTLMRLEPHSPAPYLVLRAIAWGRMSLAELMRHFINSGYDLQSLYGMLGMDEAEEPGEPAEPPDEDEPYSRSRGGGNRRRG